MLDIKRIRKNPEELVAAMKARRNKGADVSGILELDEKRREVIQKTEQLKANNQMLWVKKMNSIRNRAEEIVNHELIYS